MTVHCDSDSIHLPAELFSFFVLLKHRLDDPRWRSILVLLAEYEEDQLPDERANIRRTIDEILANEPLELPEENKG